MMYSNLINIEKLIIFYFTCFLVLNVPIWKLGLLSIRMSRCRYQSYSRFWDVCAYLYVCVHVFVYVWSYVIIWFCLSSGKKHEILIHPCFTKYCQNMHTKIVVIYKYNNLKITMLQFYGYIWLFRICINNRMLFISIWYWKWMKNTKRYFLLIRYMKW